VLLANYSANWSKWQLRRLKPTQKARWLIKGWLQLALFVVTRYLSSTLVCTLVCVYPRVSSLINKKNGYLSKAYIALINCLFFTLSLKNWRIQSNYKLRENLKKNVENISAWHSSRPIFLEIYCILAIAQASRSTATLDLLHI